MRVKRGEIEIELPQRVEREQRHRGVGAAAAQPGFGWNALAQIDRDVARRRGLPGGDVMQQRRRLPHQVAAIGRDVGLVARHGQRAAPRGHRDVVEQRQRLKDGLQIVEAVGTRSEDTEIEIDFRERRQTELTACSRSVA